MQRSAMAHRAHWRGKKQTTVFAILRTAAGELRDHFRRKRKKRKSTATMTDLNDHLLQDVGISRADLIQSSSKDINWF